MGKLVQKYLLTFLLALAIVDVAHAAATTFTDVHVKKTLVVDGAVTAGSVNCSNVSTTTLTANDLIATYGVKASTFTATGLITLGNSTAYSLKVSSITAAIPAGTPSAAGLIAFDSSYVMYISTGTGAGAWVKVGGQ
jgi:hypothetical protein